MGREYEIRLFDTPLLDFTIEDGAFGVEAHISDYEQGKLSLFPPGLVLTGEGVWNWLEARAIPTNRKNAVQICEALGFSLGDTEALYKTSLGLSLNDSYWVVPKGFTGRFDNYNLFENGFSEAIGALAVSGEKYEPFMVGNTPELSTDGNLRKGWRIISGERVLYKGASDGSVPGEPYSEYLASLIMRDAGLDSVTYGLDTWAGELCSTCANFASKEVSYVPFAVASGLTDFAGALWYMSELGTELFEQFCNMLAYDALLSNTDRHLTNFGLLCEARTGNVVGLAPVFDNGRSLFYNIQENDSKRYLIESRYSRPAFGGQSFDEMLRRFAGPEQVRHLENTGSRGLVGNVEVSGERAAAIDEYLRVRSEELLEDLVVIDHEELVERVGEHMKTRQRAQDLAIRRTPVLAAASARESFMSPIEIDRQLAELNSLDGSPKNSLREEVMQAQDVSNNVPQNVLDQEQDAPDQTDND